MNKIDLMEFFISIGMLKEFILIDLSLFLFLICIIDLLRSV